MFAAIGDSGADAGEFRFREFPGDPHKIGFTDFVPWMGESGDVIPVVGEEDHSFALLVEPPGREEPDRRIEPDKVDGFSRRVRVCIRADIAARLVEHDVVKAAGRFDRAAVERDGVGGQDAESGLADGPAVHGDASGFDEIAGGAARGNSRRTEKFNKSFFGTGHGQSNFNLMFT